MENRLHYFGKEKTAILCVGLFPRGPLNEPVSIHSWEECESTYGPFDDSYPSLLSLKGYFVNGGAGCTVIRIESTDQDHGLLTIVQQANTVLNDMSQFDILICPDIINMDPFKAVECITSFYPLCKDHSCLLLMDIPSVLKEPGDIEGWLNINPLLRQPCGIAYHPPLKTPDSPNPMPNSGAVAALFEQKDTRYGIWISPSGIKSELDDYFLPYTTLDNPATIKLNDLGINTVRKFKTTKTVLWGKGTLCGLNFENPYYKYIPIYRLILIIESYIKQLIPINTLEELTEKIRTLITHLYTHQVLCGPTQDVSYSLNINDKEKELKLGLSLLQEDDYVFLKFNY